jgi:hypothetical protein
MVTAGSFSFRASGVMLGDEGRRRGAAVGRRAGSHRPALAGRELRGWRVAHPTRPAISDEQVIRLVRSPPNPSGDGLPGPIGTWITTGARIWRPAQDVPQCPGTGPQDARGASLRSHRGIRMARRDRRLHRRRRDCRVPLDQGRPRKRRLAGRPQTARIDCEPRTEPGRLSNATSTNDGQDTPSWSTLLAGSRTTWAPYASTTCPRPSNATV